MNIRSKLWLGPQTLRFPPALWVEGKYARIPVSARRAWRAPIGIRGRLAQRSFESAFKGRAPGSGAGDSLSSFELSWQRYRERTEKAGIRIREGEYVSATSQVKSKKGGETCSPHSKATSFEAGETWNSTLTSRSWSSSW